MATLTSNSSFTITDASLAIVDTTVRVMPAVAVGSGLGRLVHPILGAFDYSVKPDEWVNIDGDAFIPPVWASTKTMGGATNVLWNGYLRDVTVEERWKSLGGLAMPIAQLRMMAMIFTTPTDPSVGSVLWFPNYISPLAFSVIPLTLKVGSGSEIALDDVINSLDEFGDPNGWVTNPVTLGMKLLDRYPKIISLF